MLLLLAASAPVALAEASGDLWGGIRTFEARLSADNLPTVTQSAARGSAKIVLDIATRTIRWEITYTGLTSAPTAIGLHGPAQPGTNGAQLIDLGGKSLASPVRGSALVPAGQIQYMLLGWTYVRISTRRYPDGEIRGKADVVAPDRPASESGAPSAGATR
jgi:hypothetical protein